MHNIDDTAFLVKFGENLMRIRLRLQVSRVQLAFEINSTEKHLRLIEGGKISVGIKFVDRIAKALNISPKDLFDFES